MSSIATLNGVQYIIPAYNDTGWAQGAGNLSLYLAAIAANTLQPTGGSFTLTANVDFGANFGIKALFVRSKTANAATTGILQLANTDFITWRNNVNNADVALDKDTSDNLRWNATKILLSGAVVNADINAAAAIAYSKLTLTNSIVNADINSAAAIAYSKLSLSASIVNADIASAAAIALTKLAALGNSFAVATNGSGVLVASAVTATELGYVSGVTSAIQTQLNATIANPLTANLNVNSKNLTNAALISFANTAIGGIVGTTTNDDAAAGNVGEYVVASNSAGVNATGNGQWYDVVNISLTAGDWDIVGIVGFNLAGSTATQNAGGISTTTGNSGTGMTLGDNFLITSVPNSVFDTFVTVAGYRKKLAGTTTIYLKARWTYSAGTPNSYGRISARRIR